MAILKSLEKTLERFAGHYYTRQPFDGGHAVPTRHDCPDRIAVGGREIRAIHLVGEQDISLAGFGYRQTSGEVNLAGRSRIVFDFSAIGSLEYDVNGIGLQSVFFQNHPQRHTGPLRVSHAA